LNTDEGIRPFRIHSSDIVSSGTAVAVLSSSHRGQKPDPSSKKATPVHFEIWTARIDLFAIGNSDKIQPLEFSWHRRGTQVPILSNYDSSRNAFMLVGGSPYRDLKSSTVTPYEPSPDEIAPIPRAGENIDVFQADPAKPQPYSWTQTSDSVTVAFPLPSTTPKTSINIKLTTNSLSLSISNSVRTKFIVPFPSFSSSAFWDSISPSSSYWTWDKEGEHSYGLLTLHLDKTHEGTKWMQVFASAGKVSKGSPSEFAPEEVEVPETLDPSELYFIRESLEKYTTALLNGEDPSGLGLGSGVPSLGEGEMDEEVDGNVGRSVCITWVGVNGNTPEWADKPGREYPFTVLSTPLPGLQCTDSENPFTLVVKEGLDGPVFALQPSSSNDVKWTHASTYPALAFVLASKQDVRFTHHNDHLVFALESGARNRGGGNMYVYRRPQGISEPWAKQAILKVGDGSGGALLGAGAMRIEGKDVILALMERQLVVVKSW
jgi:hypothetical protein